MKDFSYITHSHPAYIENLYKDFVQNPESVDPDYRKFFEGFDFAITNAANGSANGKAAETVAEPRQTGGIDLALSWCDEIQLSQPGAEEWNGAVILSVLKLADSKYQWSEGANLLSSSKRTEQIGAWDDINRRRSQGMCRNQSEP